MAAALGASTGFTRGLADARGFDTIGLPRLADTPDITVEPHADMEPAVSVTATNPSADVSIRVVPGADVGILTLTEDAP